ncbi:MAG TPA: hypothetical protein VMU69_13715 [Bradyrhizobium sp.]|nr:hypothetical protein [Bradyrhizobium sp.]
MNTAVERILALTAASNRPGVTAMKIAIPIIFLSICVPRFAPGEADNSNQTP